MPQFSKYVVYVDESGDHGMASIDPQFPVFSLSFCIASKFEYAEKVVPSMQLFKFKYWGHDAIILHEHEIRKTLGDFSFLRRDAAIRLEFLSDLTNLIEHASFKIVACVINKEKHQAKYPNPWNPYQVALKMCLERLLSFLNENCTKGSQVHVVFECRGKEEDRQLELEFRRIVSGANDWGWVRRDFGDFDFQPRFAKKSVNSTGLQLADLTARPLALRVLRPEQSNRALKIIEKKLISFKVFP